MVTFGTDGFVDYVQVQDQRYMLGSVSVLKLIVGLAPTRTARVALKEFVSSQRVELPVDLDRMWAMLPFRRARFSSANPLMGGLDRQDQVARCDATENQDAMLKIASYDTFAANVELAEDIVAKVAATDEAIERLKTAGKRFDSVRAKQDLHKIASRVAEIAQNVDLAQPWVSNDLADLSKKANEIHGLFEPAV